MHIDETTTTITPGHIVFAINSAQAEEGCIHYQLYKEAGQPGSYAMIETWATQVISLPETTMLCKSEYKCRQLQCKPELQCIGNILCQDDLTRHSKAAHVKAFQEATKGNIEAKVQVFQPV